MRFRALIAGFLVALLGCPATAAITITQIAGGANGSSTTLTTPNTTVDCPIGSTIIMLTSATTTTLSSASDSAGNTYSAPLDAIAGTGVNFSWVYAVNTAH